MPLKKWKETRTEWLQELRKVSKLILELNPNSLFVPYRADVYLMQWEVSPKYAIAGDLKHLLRWCFGWQVNQWIDVILNTKNIYF